MHGICHLNDVFTFYSQWTQFSSGAAFDATGSPAYRIYEETTDTAILTGSFALLDDANTVGLYRAQVTLSAANGFEEGKCYCIRATATIDGVAMAQIVGRFVIRLDAKKMIRYFTNINVVDTSTGAGTVYDESNVAAYTYTVTHSGSTRTKGAIT